MRTNRICASKQIRIPTDVPEVSDNVNKSLTGNLIASPRLFCAPDKSFNLNGVMVSTFMTF